VPKTETTPLRRYTRRAEELHDPQSLLQCLHFTGFVIYTLQPKGNSARLRQAHPSQSDTPGKAGGFMSGAASKAVGPSDGHRWHCGTVLRRQPGPGRAERHSLAPPHRRPSRPPRRVPSRVHRCRRALRGGAARGGSCGVSPSGPAGALYSRNAQSCSSRTGQTSGLPQRLS
jgi:hypothetical protein